MVLVAWLWLPVRTLSSVIIVWTILIYIYMYICINVWTVDCICFALGQFLDLRYPFSRLSGVA